QVRIVSMWLYADAVIPAILIGQIIGRWGNYFNQELYGPIITSESLAQFYSRWLPYLYVDGYGWVQPLFLYEGLLNFIGLLTIFMGVEFVKIRKAGDLAMLYFLWYGIVRLCLEPLRYHEFTFASTYVMSGLWVGFAIILIVLNHAVFPKMRAYRVKYIAFIGWYNFIQLRSTQSQLQRKHKKLSQLNRGVIDVHTKEKINATGDLVKALTTKCNNQKEKYDRIKLNFQRRPNEMLYYRGQ
ncbi:MAG: prolipoprotein diacylglyceryl transferase, partial [Mycoplasmataceae bacterium]|nr:prolipoprotein diacylglyceryl transferase [Mycoplasmataceae bacterium]